ncbi:allophanate hydrolase subunit 1 [Thiotrichales bacterium 19S3-7]|nr:allophanate hydrolase subunit 1 [Thiotrichales bacterium 19S3-7]MCF6801884.1 allophanate hydrolase subunit 1 [Thiotrichales bacterium 19S3-11]
MHYYLLGDQCLIFSFGDVISKELSHQVLCSYYALVNNESFLDQFQITDLVPSYNALAFHFLNDRKDKYIKLVVEAEQLIKTELKRKTKTWLKNSNQWQVDVSYCGHDLARVASYTKLTEKEVIDLHCLETYQIAMLGFVPFFPYLIGLNPKLEVPRRQRARVRVNKGSVALAGKQTGIYSQSSPGGWNIIGSTDFDLFESLKPGDTLKFNEI